MSGPADDLSNYIEICGDRLANVHLSRVDGRRLHLPLDRHPDIVRVVGALQDCGYSGPFTLEIDDLNFTRPFTAREKIAVLAADRAFLAQCFS
jgi:sugar phosphate isomerase/epimerase